MYEICVTHLSCCFFRKRSFWSSSCFLMSAFCMMACVCTMSSWGEGTRAITGDWPPPCQVEEVLIEHSPIIHINTHHTPGNYLHFQVLSQEKINCIVDNFFLKVFPWYDAQYLVFLGQKFLDHIFRNIIPKIPPHSHKNDKREWFYTQNILNSSKCKLLTSVGNGWMFSWRWRTWFTWRVFTLRLDVGVVGWSCPGWIGDGAVRWSGGWLPNTEWRQATFKYLSIKVKTTLEDPGLHWSTRLKVLENLDQHSRNPVSTEEPWYTLENPVLHLRMPVYTGGPWSTMEDFVLHSKIWQAIFIQLLHLI